MKQLIFIYIAVALAACSPSPSVSEAPAGEQHEIAGQVSVPNALDCLNPVVLTALRDALVPEALVRSRLGGAILRRLQVRRDSGNAELLAPSVSSIASYDRTTQEGRSDDGNRLICESDIILARPFEFSAQGLEQLRSTTTQEPVNEVVVATDGRHPQILVEEYSYLLRSPGWLYSFNDFCTGNYASECRYAVAEDQVYRVEPDLEYIASLRVRAHARYEVVRTEQGEIVARLLSTQWPADVPDAVSAIDRERLTRRGEPVERRPWCGFKGENSGQPIYQTYTCVTAEQICDAPGALPGARCVPPG